MAIQIISKKFKFFNVNFSNSEQTNSLSLMASSSKVGGSGVGADLLNLTEVTKIIDIIGKIDTFSFDIFALNSLVESKTMTYVAYEIFSRLNYFDMLIKDENKFKGFINQMTEGYSRKIPYHNDLHATDVFQTLYVIFDKGNIAEVKIESF